MSTKFKDVASRRLLQAQGRFLQFQIAEIVKLAETKEATDDDVSTFDGKVKTLQVDLESWSDKASTYLAGLVPAGE